MRFQPRTPASNDSRQRQPATPTSPTSTRVSSRSTRWILLSGLAFGLLFYIFFLSMLSTQNLADIIYRSQYEFSQQKLAAFLANANVGSHSRGTSSRKDKDKKVIEDMNIVLFYADDWTWRTVGAVNKHVKTPNIDAMAKRGMLFRHNCVTTSICWQSRATKVTGMYAAVHGHLLTWSDALLDMIVMWNQTLYPRLFSAGYYSGFVGKWHSLVPYERMPYTWNFYRFIQGEHWWNVSGRMKHITEINRDDAFDFLNELKKHNEENRAGMTKQKFALTVSFFATHAQDCCPDQQFMPQNYSEHLYSNATIPVPKTATDEAWKKMPWFFANGFDTGRRRWELRFNTPEKYQYTVKRIYRMASEVDDAVGAIMDEVKKMGYYDNTMFIFTTDNGFYHGEHGLAGKWYPHEESIRVPLIIQDPRMPDHLRGTVNDEFTLNIDLAPTLLSAAGLPIPENMQGRDIAQLYLGDYQETARNWRKDFFYEWNQGDTENAEGHRNVSIEPAVFALVRKDYKYFYWPNFKYEQLFQIESDPFEESDIINTTLQTQPGVLEEIKARYAFLKKRSQSGYPV